METLQKRIERLYTSRARGAMRFRFALIAFDLVTISYFVVTSILPHEDWLIYVDTLIGLVLVAELAARLLIARDRIGFFLSLGTVMDVLVIVTLVLPLVAQNLAFLRVVRTLRLVRSYHVLRDMRKQFRFFAQHEEIIQSVVNLLVFVFVITAVVYVIQVGSNPDIKTYLDALYFTVTTLTTTGFGDITLRGDSGHLLSVIIMVVGVSLFLRLVQTIFRPNKVRHACKQCGLGRHDPDAVHCKHCGAVLNIATEGE